MKEIDELSKDEYIYLHEVFSKAKKFIELSDREFSLIMKMRMLDGTRKEIIKTLNQIYDLVRSEIN